MQIKLYELAILSAGTLISINDDGVKPRRNTELRYVSDQTPTKLVTQANQHCLQGLARSYASTMLVKSVLPVSQLHQLV